MSHIREPRPRWWALYLLSAIAAGLLWLEARARLTSAGHEAARLCLVFAVFALVAAWLRAENAALLRQTMHDVTAAGGSHYTLITTGQLPAAGWPRPEALSSDSSEDLAYSELFDQPVTVFGVNQEGND